MQVPITSENSKRSMATDPAIARARPSRYRKARKAAYRAPAKKYAAAGRRQPRTQQISKELAIKVPDCAVHYIDSLFDPWDTPAGVCIPAGQFPIPSQKVKVHLRGTFALGTSGYGYITFSPCIASNLPSLTVTNTNSAGTAGSAFNAYTNLTTVNFNRLPFDTTDLLAKTVQGRVVAAGVRVRYAGTEDSRSGIYLSIEEQDHNTLVSEAFNTLYTYSNVRSSRPAGDGNWDASVSYSGPTSPQMVEFDTDSYPISSPAADSVPFVIACQGKASDPMEYEAVVHVEYIGSKVPGKTQSHADTVAYSKVLESAKEISAREPLTPENKTEGKQSFFSKLLDTLPQMVNVGMGIASSIATRNPLPLVGSLSGMGQNLLTQSSQPRLTGRQRMIMA